MDISHQSNQLIAKGLGISFGMILVASLTLLTVLFFIGLVAT